MKPEKDVLSLLFILVVANISVVKPEKAEQLENIILSVRDKLITHIECAKRSIPRKSD